MREIGILCFNFVSIFAIYTAIFINNPSLILKIYSAICLFLILMASFLRYAKLVTVKEKVKKFQDDMEESLNALQKKVEKDEKIHEKTLLKNHILKKMVLELQDKLNNKEA